MMTCAQYQHIQIPQIYLRKTSPQCHTDLYQHVTVAVCCDCRHGLHPSDSQVRPACSVCKISPQNMPAKHARKTRLQNTKTKAAFAARTPQLLTC